MTGSAHPLQIELGARCPTYGKRRAVEVAPSASSPRISTVMTSAATTTGSGQSVRFLVPCEFTEPLAEPLAAIEVDGGHAVVGRRTMSQQRQSCGSSRVRKRGCPNV